MSSTAPKALLDDINKGDNKLKHTSAPKESPSATHNKMLVGVMGKHELNHVETRKSGLSEADKQNFINKVKDEE